MTPMFNSLLIWLDEKREIKIVKIPTEGFVIWKVIPQVTIIHQVVATVENEKIDIFIEAI